MVMIPDGRPTGRDDEVDSVWPRLHRFDHDLFEHMAIIRNPACPGHDCPYRIDGGGNREPVGIHDLSLAGYPTGLNELVSD
jgi:hypothetical protein